MKQKHLLLLVLFSIISTLSFPQKNNGIYVWPSTFLEMQGEDSVYFTLKQNNITDIYLLVKGEAGFSLFPSDYTITDYYKKLLSEENDETRIKSLQKSIKYFSDKTLLTRIIDKAHQNNIKIHAWFIISGDRHYVESHPGAEVVQLPDTTKYKFPHPVTDKGHINLAYPPYKEYIFSLVKKALEYPFDGLMLDKIRYTSLVYTWDEIHISKALRAGVDITKVMSCAVETMYGKNEETKEDFIDKYRDNDKDITEWVTIKKEDIEEYVKEAYKIAKEKKIILSASFMPEGAYDESYADVYYAQNYRELSHYLDYIVIMAYPKSFNEPETWVKMVTRNAIEKSSCKIWTAIQCFDTVSATSVFDQAKNVRLAQADGIVIFRLGSMDPNLWDSYNRGMKLNITNLFHSQIPGIIYKGKGTIRNCWIKTAKALYADENISPILLNEEELQDPNNFEKKDFIILPGGGGSSEAEALGTTGLKNIENFVYSGKGYIGICAGSYLPIKGYNNNMTMNLQIVNAEVKDIVHWNRGSGKVKLRITKKHPIFSNINSDYFELNYFSGPILEPSDLELPKYKELAMFKTEIGNEKNNLESMIGKTAILESVFHKGKIILFSPHPELTTGMGSLLINAVKYVSGK